MADAPPSSPVVRRRQSGVVVPEKVSLSGRVIARMVHGLVVSVDRSLRYRWDIDPAGRAAIEAGPVIFAIWHNRLSLCLRLYHRMVQRRFAGRRMAAIVSASRDGGLLARILELFEVQPVRGSSSRRGAQAILELTSWAERGYDLAITPDGPRGPRYVVQEGAVTVGQYSGLPVIPACFSLGWKIQLKSWDRFQLPIPFSSITVRTGEPVRIPREATQTARAEFRQVLEERLRALTED